MSSAQTLFAQEFTSYTKYMLLARKEAGKIFSAHGGVVPC